MSQTFKGQRVLRYNFTMTQPALVQDNFTVPVTLESNPNSLSLRAYVINAFNLSSISALGEYDINFTIRDNDANVVTSSFGIYWAHEPYGLRAQGPTPDTQGSMNFTNVKIGTNLIEFQFILFSRLTQYGQGYYQVALGPLVVEITPIQKSVPYAVTLEILGGMILVPVSYYISVRSYKKKMGPPK